MSLRTVARSYARAYLDTLSDDSALERHESELIALGGAVRSTPELREYLAAPHLPPESKRDAIEKILKGAGASKEILGLACLLVERQRILLTPEIAEEFSALVRERLGIVDAEVVSARPLEAAVQNRVLEALGRRTGSKVRAAFRVDPTVLGGLRARVGTTIYDGSLRARLGRLRDHILGE
jgi:F-type H+-transporting ATPase subunit delta